MSDFDDIQSLDEALEKSPTLPGNRFAPISLGEVMVCSQAYHHPRRRFRRKGQTCHVCGAILVPLSTYNSSGSGGASA